MGVEGWSENVYRIINARRLEELFDRVMKVELADSISFEIKVHKSGQREPEEYLVERIVNKDGAVQYSARRKIEEKTMEHNHSTSKWPFHYSG